MTAILSSHSLALAAADKNITLNQVAQAAFGIQRPAMVASINRAIQQKNFYRGTFFKGEIPESKKIVDALAHTTLKVIESAGGFTIMAVQGKGKVVVKIEIVDILMGKIKVAGKNLQLNKEMSYLELSQALAPLILGPQLKKQTLKKTSSLDPSGWLITKAWAQEESDPIAMIGIFLQQPLLYHAAASISSSLGVGVAATTAIYMAVFVAGAYVLDFSFNGLYDLFSGRDNKAIAKVQGLFDRMLLSCQKGRSKYYRTNTLLSEEKISKLQGKELEHFQNFQKLWQASSLQKTMPVQKQKNIGCQKLVKKEGLEYLSKSVLDQVFPVPSARKLIFAKRIKPLCQSYQKIIDCFISVPSPFGEKKHSKESSIHDGRIQIEKSEFRALYESLSHGEILN